MTDREMWDTYIGINPQDSKKKYVSWCFGGSGDELAYLVKENIKTATASAYPLYQIENEPLPPVNGLNIILDARGNAICITETTKVYTCPFNKVSDEHAYKEGEGDRTLEYWRKVHSEFFSHELSAVQLTFSEQMLVVCEEFKVVFYGK